MNIELKPSDILQSRIPATMARIRKEMRLSEGADLPFDYWKRCLKETEKDLQEVNLDPMLWKEWLEPFFDPIETEILSKLEKDLGKKWYAEEISKIQDVFKNIDIHYAPWMTLKLHHID